MPRRLSGLVLVAAAVVGGVVAPSAARAGLIVPAYNSLPGAFVKIYLDFDGDVTPTYGDYQPGTTPAYDVDGDPTAFSAQELTNVHQIWQSVAEKFSPFNVNVTTVDPGNQNNGETSRIVIGGDGAWGPAGAGGIAILGSFTNFGFPNLGFVFPGRLANGNPKYVAEAAAHEAGHGFGLKHQSLYDADRNFLAEYHPGDAERAPIMGISYYAARGQWWLGPTPSSSSLLQDDLRVLSRTGVTLAPNFGYRADDHGSTAATATPLDVAADFSISGYGIIEQVTDADFFSFTSPGGSAEIFADVAPFGAMLDLSLSLFDDAGALLASAATASLGERLTIALAPGEYLLSVTSAGGYGDVGQYWLSGTVIPEPATAAAATLLIAAVVARRRRG